MINSKNIEKDKNMKKFETLNDYEPYRRYEKLKIYVFSTGEICECFDELFNLEIFKNNFYDTLNSNYNASEVIDLSPDEKDEILQIIADKTIRDLVDYQEILIIKDLEER